MLRRLGSNDLRRVLIVAGVLAAAGGASAEDGVATQPTSQASPTTQSAAGGALLTNEELSGLFRAKEYDAVLRETGRLLNARSVPAGYNAFDLQLLRAESYLQLRNGGMAVQAFERAEQSAPDAGKRWLMEATVLLIKRSVGLRYVARNTDENGEPRAQGDGKRGAVQIDLLSLAKRTAALKALYTDQWIATKGALEKARHAATLGEFGAIRRDLVDLGILEEAVMGKEEATQGLREQTAGEMNGTMGSLIAGIGKEVAGLQERAQQEISVRTPSGYVGSSGQQTMVTSLRPRGLTQEEAIRLERIESEAKDVPTVVENLAKELHVDVLVFKETVVQGAALETQAKEVLSNNRVYVPGTNNAVIRGESRP